MTIFKELDQIQHQIDHIFDALTETEWPGRTAVFSPLAGLRRHFREPVWRNARLFPLLNVEEKEGVYEVSAEIPGIKTEDLEIKIEGDTLTLKGERKPFDMGETAAYHRRERATGIFQRSLTLPKKVDAENVKAVYKNGVLTIVLPIEKTIAPKQITIKTE